MWQNWLIKNSDPFQSGNGMYVFPDLTPLEIERIAEDFGAKVTRKGIRIGGKFYTLSTSSRGDFAVIDEMERSFGVNSSLQPQSESYPMNKKAYNQLVQLGKNNPELRKHIRPVLREIEAARGAIANRDIAEVLGPVQDAVGKMNAAIVNASRDIIRLPDGSREQAAQVLYDMLKLEVSTYEDKMRSLKKAYGVR